MGPQILKMRHVIFVCFKYNVITPGETTVQSREEMPAQGSERECGRDGHGYVQVRGRGRGRERDNERERERKSRREIERGGDNK